MSDIEYENRFSGIRRLYGDQKAARIRNSHILIIGVGGVGSWVVEALARSGVGSMTLVDFDDICISNTNRQIHALTENVGKMKTQALKERVYSINPHCKVRLIEESFGEETAEMIYDQSYDVVIDCIDKSINKEIMAKFSAQRKIPHILVGSAGGRIDPSRIEVSDLSKTEMDPMLKVVRKSLRKNHGFPRLPKKMGITVVYSTEKPSFPTSDGCTSVERPQEFLKPLDCQTGFGTATHITGIFAYLAVAEAIKQL